MGSSFEREDRKDKANRMIEKRNLKVLTSLILSFLIFLCFIKTDEYGIKSIFFVKIKAFNFCTAVTLC